MRKLQAIMAISALALTPAALAQEMTIIVDLSDISADLAAELEIELEEVPTTVNLSPDIAAVVCGVDAGSLADSCIAVTSSAELTALLEDELDGDEDTNSAAAFAPGQQEGPARDFAPGQQDGPATDFAPGQVKKDIGGDDDLDEEDDVTSRGNSANAPGLQEGDARDHAPGQTKQDEHDGSDSASDEDDSSPSDDAPGQNK
ncbi:hypothetical protein [Devosia nitrariae]|uniref:Uncharacterized protein n=1 Tax=Devosia nitrariae TaxID=2071872 RepID=A0ABQ5WB37_9HYPH|nr:hypothetical protein [Devosia nitrariae]GLQ57276.1 hypothetical protein GCM10010862_45350 [Devosia nitrariae]